MNLKHMLLILQNRSKNNKEITDCCYNFVFITPQVVQCTPVLPLSYSEPQCILFYKGNLRDDLGINHFKQDKAIDLFDTSNSLFMEQDKIC